MDGVILHAGLCGEAPTQLDDDASVAYILAHELGHYLGLYHPVEPSGATDHLADTAETMEEAIDYLMTSGSDATQPGALTPLQIKVLRQHPLVGHTP